jgi:DNA-binding LacI/PurR family transcriptional regulator
LSTAGYDLILYNVETVARRDECLRAVPRGERLDGLLILSLAPDDVEVQQFAAHRRAAVLVDAYHPALPTVQIDDVAGARTAVRHLIDLGHRRIAYVGETLDRTLSTSSPSAIATAAIARRWTRRASPTARSTIARANTAGGRRGA